MPRATTDDQPEPFWLSTLTGITVAIGATPLAGGRVRQEPGIVLARCVPGEFWSSSHVLVGAETLAFAPPPPLKALPNCVATRSCGKYLRQLSSRPVSTTATYTPAPLYGT